MKLRCNILAGAIAILMAGCAPRGGVAPDERSEADRSVDAARSYEQTGDLRRATDMYTSIAETSPRSPSGATAAYRAGLLLVNPHNPVRDDALALVWFRSALGRSLSAEDRSYADAFVAQLEHLEDLHRDVEMTWRLNDSLRTVVRRQGLTIASYSRRTQQLEQQLFAANTELKKLKDIDLQIARSRRRR